METQTPQQKKIKVCVGMSGGVDSSVTAALLVQHGYDVVGVYMKNWNTESPTLGDRTLERDAYRMECPWYEDYLDAKRVALQLGIPFHMWDFREAYKKKVFDYFIGEIEKGRTPNPDIYCNSLVKFDDFQKRALEELDVDYVATGHYARRIEEDDRYYLQIPKDSHKDQTYFLYRLNQEQLSKALFPLADYTKPEIRDLAVSLDLPNKYKKDSQGICFIGEVDVRQFVAQWLQPKPGDIHDLQGRVIGQHQGVHLYTIGEKITVDNKSVSQYYPELKHDIPVFYVSHKSIRDNILTAVPGFDHPALYYKEIELEDCISLDEAVVSAPLRVRLRHGGQLCDVESIEGAEGRLTLVLKEPQRGIAPGQHCVLYGQDGRVVTGGLIA